MRMRDVAIICHEADRALSSRADDYNHTDWNASPQWLRDGVDAGVRFYADNPDASAADRHDDGVKQLMEHGWVVGSTWDEAAKIHPYLIPFYQLPEQLKARAHMFRAICHALLPFCHDAPEFWVRHHLLDEEPSTDHLRIWIEMYRAELDKIAAVLGPAAYQLPDGSTSDVPVLEKLPDLVRALAIAAQSGDGDIVTFGGFNYDRGILASGLADVGVPFVVLRKEDGLITVEKLSPDRLRAIADSMEDGDPMDDPSTMFTSPGRDAIEGLAAAGGDVAERTGEALAEALAGDQTGVRDEV